MATATTQRLTVEEFLAMEETKPYRELICGEAVEKAMPGQDHSRRVFRINLRLGAALEARPAGEAFTELRHVFLPEDRVYLPDISYIAAERLPPRDQNPVEVVPDFVIEVLSPDDRASRVMEKVQFYLRAEVPLLWVVDPERETVTVYRPGEAAREFTGDATISAAPVLPEFTIALGDLFATD